MRSKHQKIVELQLQIKDPPAATRFAASQQREGELITGSGSACAKVCLKVKISLASQLLTVTAIVNSANSRWPADRGAAARFALSRDFVETCLLGVELAGHSNTLINDPLSATRSAARQQADAKASGSWKSPELDVLRMQSARIQLVNVKDLLKCGWASSSF